MRRGKGLVLIRGALSHLPGIGRERLQKLNNACINDWRQLLHQPLPFKISPGQQKALTTAVRRCEQAVEKRDIPFLVDTFSSADHWRILSSFFQEAAYLDIETAGLDVAAPVTVIAIFQTGRCACYVGDLNLTKALGHLKRISLLVTFNGSTFDLPCIKRAFQIPTLQIPHIDLRWVCHHMSLHGGLKSIEQQLAIERPRELRDIDGSEAVWLWNQYRATGDGKALQKLVRYCAADTLTLRALSARILEQQNVTHLASYRNVDWSLLNSLTP